VNGGFYTGRGRLWNGLSTENEKYSFLKDLGSIIWAWGEDQERMERYRLFAKLSGAVLGVKARKGPLWTICKRTEGALLGNYRVSTEQERWLSKFTGEAALGNRLLRASKREKGAGFFH